MNRSVIASSISLLVSSSIGFLSTLEYPGPRVYLQGCHSDLPEENLVARVASSLPPLSQQRPLHPLIGKGKLPAIIINKPVVMKAASENEPRIFSSSSILGVYLGLFQITFEWFWMLKPITYSISEAGLGLNHWDWISEHYRVAEVGELSGSAK